MGSGGANFPLWGRPLHAEWRHRSIGGESQMVKAMTTKTTHKANIANFPDPRTGFWRRWGPEAFGVRSQWDTFLLFPLMGGHAGDRNRYQTGLAGLSRVTRLCWDAPLYPRPNALKFCLHRPPPGYSCQEWKKSGPSVTSLSRFLRVHRRSRRNPQSALPQIQPLNSSALAATEKRPWVG